ncbi:hypothetical protein V1281_002779 [Nitrobacteraceae bacterium AZCC 2161]
MASTKIMGWMAAAALVTVQTSAFAQGTEQQREACTPDAFRLCTFAMPDPGRVENCLRTAGPRLSAACYAVFYPPTAANPPPTTRGQASSTARAQAPSFQQKPLPPPRSMDDDD